jgi:hypothetical protein
MFTTEKKSYYDYIESNQDNRTNVGFDYEGQIFEKTLSSITLGGDSNRTSMIASMEKVVFRLIESTKWIRNFVNYRVPKNNKYVR